MDVIADVATIVIALAIIVVGLVAIFGALKVRRMMQADARRTSTPPSSNLTAVSENAKALSDRLRRNVEELSATVSDDQRSRCAAPPRRPRQRWASSTR